MISREHAKEVLENLVNNEVLKSVLLRTDIEAMKCAISALSESKTQMIDKSNFDEEQYKTDLQSAYDCGYNKALSENKGEWIPVSERLPENTDDVLVTDGVNMFVAWCIKDNGFWKSYDEKYAENIPILAWQPLPEPYKENDT